MVVSWGAQKQDYIDNEYILCPIDWEIKVKAREDNKTN